MHKEDPKRYTEDHYPAGHRLAGMNVLCQKGKELTDLGPERNQTLPTDTTKKTTFELLLVATELQVVRQQSSPDRTEEAQCFTQEGCQR